MSETATDLRKTQPARSARGRLRAADWVGAALDAMVGGGVQAVRIDSLAADLGVTKGSFYSHFRSHDDLLAAVARHWSEGRIGEVAREVLALPGGPRAKLELFWAIYTRENLMELDRAFRAWALADPRAAKAVKKANAIVREMMARIFTDFGFSPEEAEFRAKVQILCGIGILFAVEYHDERPPEQRARDGARLLDFLTHSCNGKEREK